MNIFDVNMDFDRACVNRLIEEIKNESSEHSENEKYNTPAKNNTFWDENDDNDERDE